MAQTNVNIRMDDSTKKAFDAFCKEIGISVSSAFNLFARTVVREHRIPFEITTDVPNETTKAAFNEYYEMQNNPEKYKRYKNFEEIMDEVLEDAWYRCFKPI